MATYVYETIPQKKGEQVRHFEIRQSMKDAALTHHPESGEPIRRVISGGYGMIKAGGASSASASHVHTHSCGCGRGGCN